MFSQQDKAFMSEAFELAQESYNYNEVPVGAIIVNNGKIIGRGRNNVITNNDVTSHAEINAIKDASNNILSIEFRAPFEPRRGRINCSLNDDGKWRWFGVQFPIKTN